MIKYIALGLISLCLFNIAAHAGGKEIKSKHKEEMGLGLGAIIGGLIGGPPGAIIGAAGGAIFGNKEEQEDLQISQLEQELEDKSLQVSIMESQFDELQRVYGQELQKVNLQESGADLSSLTNGVSLSVYFRTNSASPDPEISAQVERLAYFLQDRPEINLHLEAHADRRGSTDFNRKLSEQRAESVKQILIDAGIPAKRLHSWAYGEKQALAADGDEEGYVFDRRVDIQLTLDTQI